MAKNKELDFNLEDLKNFLPAGADEQKRWGFIALAPFVGFLLFVFMVLLVSTGDAGDIVKGRKIGDVIMPDRVQQYNYERPPRSSYNYVPEVI